MVAKFLFLLFLVFAAVDANVNDGIIRLKERYNDVSYITEAYSILNWPVAMNFKAMVYSPPPVVTETETMWLAVEHAECPKGMPETECAKLSKEQKLLQVRMPELRVMKQIKVEADDYGTFVVQDEFYPKIYNRTWAYFLTESPLGSRLLRVALKTDEIKTFPATNVLSKKYITGVVDLVKGFAYLVAKDEAAGVGRVVVDRINMVTMELDSSYHLYNKWVTDTDVPEVELDVTSGFLYVAGRAGGAGFGITRINTYLNITQATYFYTGVSSETYMLKRMMVDPEGYIYMLFEPKVPTSPGVYDYTLVRLQGRDGCKFVFSCDLNIAPGGCPQLHFSAGKYTEHLLDANYLYLATSSGEIVRIQRVEGYIVKDKMTVLINDDNSDKVAFQSGALYKIFAFLGTSKGGIMARIEIAEFCDDAIPNADCRLSPNRLSLEETIWAIVGGVVFISVVISGALFAMRFSFKKAKTQ